MARSRGLRVLLAGGEGGGALEEALRSAGHDVSASADDAGALTTAKASCLDVVILDVEGLQESDPFALAQGIRAVSFWRKPLFVVMAQEGGRCESCCREAGIDLLFVKPVAPQLVTGFLG